MRGYGRTREWACLRVYMNACVRASVLRNVTMSVAATSVQQLVPVVAALHNYVSHATTHAGLHPLLKKTQTAFQLSTS